MGYKTTPKLYTVDEYLHIPAAPCHNRKRQKESNLAKTIELALEK